MRRIRRDLVRVGLFVLAAGTVLVGGLAWIAGSRLFRPVSTYTIIFEDSVSGLNAGANVEYQGVVVGRVRDLHLTEEVPPFVAVLIDVKPGTPIRQDTWAALAGSLVTGIKFIQLQGGTKARRLLPSGGTIRGDVASLEQFRDRLAEIADRALVILRRLEESVFTSDNSERVNQFLADLSAVARSLSGTLETFRTEQTGKDIAALVRRMNEVADSVNAVIRDFYGRRDRIYGNLESLLAHLDETVREMRELVKAASTQLGGTTSSVGMLVGELSTTTDRLQETLDVIRSDPSVLLRGREVPEREFEK